MSRKKRKNPQEPLNRVIGQVDPETLRTLKAQVREQQRLARAMDTPVAERRAQRRGSKSNQAAWRSVAKAEYLAGPVVTRQATPAELAAARRRRRPP